MKTLETLAACIDAGTIVMLKRDNETVSIFYDALFDKAIWCYAKNEVYRNRLVCPRDVFTSQVEAHRLKGWSIIWPA